MHSEKLDEVKESLEKEPFFNNQKQLEYRSIQRDTHAILGSYHQESYDHTLNNSLSSISQITSVEQTFTADEIKKNLDSLKKLCQEQGVVPEGEDRVAQIYEDRQKLSKYELIQVIFEKVSIFNVFKMADKIKLLKIQQEETNKKIEQMRDTATESQKKEERLLEIVKELQD